MYLDNYYLGYLFIHLRTYYLPTCLPALPTYILIFLLYARAVPATDE
jgi:hypothetical protein